jgi:hypothetical protein
MISTHMFRSHNGFARFMILMVCLMALSSVAWAATCPRVNSGSDASHHRHFPPHHKAQSVLHGDLKALYYGEVCLACLRDGTQRRNLVAVPEVDASTGKDIVDIDAVREAPVIAFEIVDRHLVSIEISAPPQIVAKSSSDVNIAPRHLPPFRILISDGESDDTLLSEQLVILNSRSNHTFLDSSVTFDINQLALLHLEPLKVFYVRLDSYSRRLTSFDGAFWLPFGAASPSPRPSPSQDITGQNERLMSFIVSPPVTSGVLGTRFHCTLSFRGTTAGDEVILEVVAKRKAPVPPQRLQVFVVEVPMELAPPSAELPLANIIIENNPKGLLLTAFANVSNQMQIADVGILAESHAPSVRAGLRLSTAWTGTERDTLRRRLWQYLTRQHSSPPSRHRYGVVIRCTSEELSREYHEEYVIPQFQLLLQQLRGVELRAGTVSSATASDDPTDAILSHMLPQETMVPPISYLRLLQLEQFRIQQDGSSVLPPDEPFLRVLLRHERDHGAIALFLVQPVPIRNLQILVVNSYNETVLLEESYEVPFVGPDRDLRVHPLFGVRRFLSDDVLWVGGDELRVHLFFDLRDSPVSPQFGNGGEQCHVLLTSSEDEHRPDDPHTKLSAVANAFKETSGKPASGHSLITIHREHLVPAYFSRASSNLGVWHHHAVRAEYERSKTREAIFHWIELSEGHVDSNIFAVDSGTRGGSGSGRGLPSPAQLTLHHAERPLPSPPVLVSIPMELALTSKLAQHSPILAPLFVMSGWKEMMNRPTGSKGGRDKVWNPRRMREVVDIALLTFCGGDDALSGVQHHTWLATLADEDHLWSRQTSTNDVDDFTFHLRAHGLSEFSRLLETRQDFIEAAFELIEETFPWLRQRGLTEQAWASRVNAMDALSIEQAVNYSEETDVISSEPKAVATELFVSPVLSWCTHSNAPTAMVVLNVTRRTVDIVLPRTQESENAASLLDVNVTCDWSNYASGETTLSQLLRFHTVLSDSTAPIVDITLSMSPSESLPNVIWLTADDAVRDDLVEQIKLDFCGGPRQPLGKMDRKWRQPAASENDITRCALKRAIKLLERRASEIPLVPLSRTAPPMTIRQRRGIARALQGAHLVMSLHLHHLRERLVAFR